MFGKQDWFRLNSSGKLVLPVSFQGWCYLAGWAAVILAPLFLLLFLGRYPEAVIWLVASSLVALLDVKKIRSRLSEPDEKDLFYIGTQEQDGNVQTQNFELHVRE